MKNSIKIVVDDKIVGTATSLELREEFIWNSLSSINLEVPTERKLREKYIVGEFGSLIFDKKQCKPFPRFFDIQFYENDKLTETIKDIYLNKLIAEKQINLDNLLFESDFVNETVIVWNSVEFSNRDVKLYKNYYNEQNKSNEVFTDEFKKKLDLGKYTSWINQLSPEQLQGLFWMIGEVKIRSGRAFDESKINEICRSLDEDKMAGSTERMTAGLRLFLEFLSGKEKTLDEVRKEIRESVK